MRIQNISVVMSQAYEGNRSVADMRTHTLTPTHTKTSRNTIIQDAPP